jgi:hypothetical protein
MIISTSKTSTSMRLLALSLSLLLLSSISQIARAQDNAPTECSCSPTVFTFVLYLNQTCDENTIQSNGGIDGAFCFTEVDVALPEPPTMPPAAEMASGDASVDPTAASERSSGASHDGTDHSMSMSMSASRATSADRRSGGEEEVRRLQPAAADPVVEVLSVQFLEFDTSGDLKVINQDDTYADVALVDGDRLKFASASSFLDTDLPLADQTDSPALVPGGASLILYGRTAGGVMVRNRFFWMYDMNCGRDNQPIKVDDEIGWVTVVSWLMRSVDGFVRFHFRSPNHHII